MKYAIIGFLGLVANIATAIELTTDNYDAETDGKTVFIKFFAPWCGHCKKMKPDWDKLMDEFKGSATQLVADVDCTSDGGKPLCDANGVKGFPTLKWGDPAGLDDYQGARSYDALQKFATENLKPICSPTNLDLCDADAKAEIEKFMKMKLEDLQADIKAKEDEVAKAESDFKEFVEGLQKQYQDEMTKKDEKIDGIKAAGLGLMKKVESAKKKSGGKDEL